MNRPFCIYLAAALSVLSLRAAADTSWIVRSRESASGMTLLHGCREAKTQLELGMRYETPEKDRNIKFRHLRIGDRGGFTFAALNERGLAIVFTGGDPTDDPRPPKDLSNVTGNFGTVNMAGKCASAPEAVKWLRAEFAKGRICGNLIFLIADTQRAFAVECTNRHFASWELPHAFCVYANCWKLPGMDDASVGTAERAARNYQREWTARELLRQALETQGAISVRDSLAISRADAADMNDPKFDKARGPRKLFTAPYNRASVDSYLFELDSEFPEVLSTVYAAWGPQRHTVYLPIPLGAADALPEGLFSEAWVGSAVRRRDAAKNDAPIDPQMLEFENRQLLEFTKAREAARILLQKDDPDGARKLLKETLARQARETADFLTGPKKSSGMPRCLQLFHNLLQYHADAE